MYFDKEILFFVTKDERVYCLGLNDFGLLGLGHVKKFRGLTEIKELSGKKIKDIFFGSYPTFLLALTEDNQIFGWGYDFLEELGIGSENH